MDAYDEILSLCKARDAKRKELEAAKPAVKAQVKPHISTPKAKTSVIKPLSYEELMSRAEQNSKNTLSITDLKVKTGDNSIVKTEKYPEIKRSHVPNKMVSKAAMQKKPVKVIKRNMQPRSEVSDLVVLNQKKRDLRSIEEIQLELKQRSKPENKEKEEVKSVLVNSEKDPEKYYAKNYSSIISNLFGYDRNKYAGDDEDDLSDMEADYSTVMAEDSRSTRLGKQEDLEEELKEIERKKRKAALLKSQKHTK